MTTKNETMKTNQTSGSTIGLVVLGVLAAAGVGAWVYQLTQGMVVTGLGQQIVWALYIAAFFSAIGAGAGLLFLVGLSEFVDLIPVEKRGMSLIAALSSFVAGGLLIMLDIGNPLQVWRILTAFRFSSMMTWDFWLLIVAVVVTLAYLFLAKKGEKAPALGVVGVVAAGAVVVLEGWMLSSMSSRPMWEGGATVVSFLLAALLGGVSLWVLTNQETGGQAVSWFKAMLVVSLVVVAAEVLTRLVGGSPRASEEIMTVVSGTAAPIFWFQILVGLGLPLALVLLGSQYKVAAGLALLGVLAEKSWLLVSGQATSWLELPSGTYFFSLVEVVAVIGVVAIGVLVFLGLEKVFDR